VVIPAGALAAENGSDFCRRIYEQRGRNLDGDREHGDRARLRDRDAAR
jgi:hypothetical protein